MTLSQAEKLIIYNQYRILEHLGLEDKEYCDVIIEALSSSELPMFVGKDDLPLAVFPDEAREAA
jgi:hypothetical protein